MIKIIQNTEYWRDRAEEARALAEEMRDPDFKRIMLGIAESYEKLVTLSEEWLKRSRKKLSEHPKSD